MLDEAVIERVAGLVKRAERILFITGAGLSADSGLPTYRGIGGLYETAVTDEGIPIEVAVSGHMMRQRPEVCWKYIAKMEEALRGARYNRAHEVIAEIERRTDHVCVLTQNVDGYHRDAGSRNVIAIHGDIHELMCTQCRDTGRVPDYSGIAIPPYCGECGGLVRPLVVLFGEMLPFDAVARLEGELSRGFDLVFSIGTTSLFPYIAQPVIDAKRAGVPTVEINPGSSEVSRLVDIQIPERAKIALDAIWNAIE